MHYHTDIKTHDHTARLLIKQSTALAGQVNGILVEYSLFSNHGNDVGLDGPLGRQRH